LKECARQAERTGARVFIHVAQNEPEVAIVRRAAMTARSPAWSDRPRDVHTVAAHAIYLSDAEFEAWPDLRHRIAHCPASNLKIEARTLPLARLVGRVPIGLGTDWTASNNSMDMLVEARSPPWSARCAPTIRRRCRSARWYAC
jgi:Cytosine deaminase and related metal-dependent hydrolases